jgi:phospholipid/cholesterol/gamma-HCH transport system ATP-binding protein
LLNSLTVGDNVALGLREHQIVPESDIKRVVADKLRLLGLEGKENEMPATLSGGMKKRVSIARALTMNPEVILYDEPTAGLDPPMADNIDNLILELNRQLGVTSVIVTHDLISVFKTADTINMLHEGRIIKTGRVEDFRTSPDEIVKEFLKRK